MFWLDLIMVRVAIGGFEHETNTYAAGVFGMTTEKSFTRHKGPPPNG